MSCKRRFTIEHVPGAADGAEVLIPSDTTEFTLQALDSSGASLEFELRTAANGSGFTVAAGQSWSEERLNLDQDLKLWVLSAAGSNIELARWEG